jgi:hypothetical protein
VHLSAASPERAAFPVLWAGRRPQLPFRGLLRLHTHYGPSIRSTAQGGLCRRASIRTVTQPHRLPATGPTDHCPGGTSTHKVIAPFGDAPEEQGRTIEFTEQANFGASRRFVSRSAKRINTFSVSSIVLPCSSVIKTLALFVIDHYVVRSHGIFTFIQILFFRFHHLILILCLDKQFARRSRARDTKQCLNYPTMRQDQPSRPRLAYCRASP